MEPIFSCCAKTRVNHCSFQKTTTKTSARQLDLLKGDRFLGDADWEIVWRYIPVSTAKTYWHRIRHGNINLSLREEENINDIIHHHGGSFAHRVRKWFTRRVLRLSGGARYDELPRRLRQTWYSYHKNYHFSHPAAGTAASLAMSAASKALEEARHQRDLELHHLNAEPRMIVEAEAWANLNDGGGADMVKSAKVMCLVYFILFYFSPFFPPLSLFFSSFSLYFFFFVFFFLFLPFFPFFSVIFFLLSLFFLLGCVF